MLNIEYFLKNQENYEKWLKSILQFRLTEGRFPMNTELWEIGIPMNRIDDVIQFLNFKITTKVLPYLEEEERRYFDNLSVKVIMHLTENNLEVLTLENLVLQLKLNVRDAKILISYINEVLKIDVEIEKILPSESVFPIITPIPIQSSPHKESSKESVSSKVQKPKYDVLDTAAEGVEGEPIEIDTRTDENRSGVIFVKGDKVDQKCPHCGHPLTSNQLKLKEKGRDVLCRKCLKIVWDKSQKCPHCGHPLTSSQLKLKEDGREVVCRKCLKIF